MRCRHCGTPNPDNGPICGNCDQPPDKPIEDPEKLEQEFYDRNPNNIFLPNPTDKRIRQETT